MQTNRLFVTLFAVLPLAACVLPGDDENDTGNQTGAESESGATEPSTSAPSTTVDDSSSGGSADSSGSDSGEETSADSSGGDTDDMPSSCVDATLFMGNPYFDGDLKGWNTEGQGVLEDPPLRSRHLAGLPDDRVAVETQFEVWGVEGGTMHRIAGMEIDPDDTRYEPNGACADVRFLKAAGIAGLPDGRLVVADTRGNGLVELRDPFGDCQAAAIAGNPSTTLDVDVPGTGSAEPGDIDGPGAMARFEGVERPVADEDGNVYVVDTVNHKIKKVADDADRTVSTLFDSGEALVMAMTAFDGTLYASGTDVGDDFVWAIDTTTGEQTALVMGEFPYDELTGAGSATPYGLANDGVDLLIASSQGFILRMSTAGDPLGVVAGRGDVFDFPEDLDLTMPLALDQVPIRSYATAQADLVRSGSNFLFTGNANGVGFHVWSINCE